MQKFLQKKGFETKVHYPKPVHKMTLYLKNYKKVNLQITEKLSKEILTLPAMEYVDKSHIIKLSSTLH